MKLKLNKDSPSIERKAPVVSACTSKYHLNEDQGVVTLSFEEIREMFNIKTKNVYFSSNQSTNLLWSFDSLFFFFHYGFFLAVLLSVLLFYFDFNLFGLSSLTHSLLNGSVLFPPNFRRRNIWQNVFAAFRLSNRSQRFRLVVVVVRRKWPTEVRIAFVWKKIIIQTFEILLIFAPLTIPAEPFIFYFESADLCHILTSTNFIFLWHEAAVLHGLRY